MGEEGQNYGGFQEPGAPYSNGGYDQEPSLGRRQDRDRDRDRDRGRDRPRDRRDRDGPDHERDRERSRSPGGRKRRGGRKSRSRSRSRSKSRSRSRSSGRYARRREKRRNKPTGWDQPPDAAQLAAQAAANPGGAPAGGNPGFGAPSMPVHPMAAMGGAPAAPAAPPASFGQIHPARLAQLGLPSSSSSSDSSSSLSQPSSSPSSDSDPNSSITPANPMMNPMLSMMMGRLPMMNPMLNPALMSALNPLMMQQAAATKQARRLYVGNIPLTTNEEELKNQIDQTMHQEFPDMDEGICVISSYLNLEKHFAFVELRTPDEANMCIQLDGMIMYQGHVLRVRRPADYNPSSHVGPTPIPMSKKALMGGMMGLAGIQQPFNPEQPTTEIVDADGVSNMVPDGPSKVFCGGLPYTLGDQEVKELLSSFGKLKAFHLVRDKDSPTSKGYCFFEYSDPDVTEAAIQGLNGIKIGDKTLTIRRAQPRGGAPVQEDTSGLGSLTAKMTPGELGALAALRASALTSGSSNDATLVAMANATLGKNLTTRVLVLMNMVTAEELMDDQEYRDIVEDIQNECSRYGEVKSLVVPRPIMGQLVPGVGKVYVEFAAIEQAMRARSEVEGRQFGGRIVQCEYLTADKYYSRQFS